MTNEKTDWDKYYQAPLITAKYSRKVSQDQFFRFLKKHISGTCSLSIAELGGANSCYYDRVQKELSPKKYLIIDNNPVGLKMLEERIEGCNNVDLLNIDLLDFQKKMHLDLVYSIGLIEHFPEQERLKVIRVHFDLLKPNGIAIISFPTPTWLYRISRRVSEMLKLWIWHDEIPLKLEEVNKFVEPFGQVKDKKILWPMFLTQAMMVIQKSS